MVPLPGVCNSDIPQTGVGCWLFGGMVFFFFKQVKGKSALLLAWRLVRGAES